MKKTSFVWLAVLLVVALLVVPMMSLTVGAAKTRGDANGDESIDMKDVLLIRKSIANMGVELNEIAADANADESVDMKDVLLIRKFIANMDVELAPMPEESSDTSETSGSDPTAPTNPSEPTQPTQPSGQVTLTLNIKEEVPRWEQNTPAGAGTYTYERGSTATFKVKVPAYQDLNTEDMTAIRGFVNLTNATLVGDPDVGELGREVEHYYTIIYTYTVQMDDNKTVTGTITSPTFEASVIEVEGSTEPTEPTQPTQPGETTTTTAGTGDVTLNYSIKEEAPRYEENTLTGSKTYARGSTATLTVKVWAYQDLNTEDMTAIRGFVNLTGATLSGNPVIGEIEDHKYPITYTYTVQMNSNVTVTGTIASPVFEPSTVSLDGQAGPTAAPTTTTQAGPTPTSTTQGGQTTTTTAGGGTGDVTLNYSIKEEAPRYTDNTLTGSKTYTRGATATLTVKVWAYQDLNTEDMTAIRGFVNLTGATLSGNPSIGEIEDHKYPITYTYTVQMNSNVTVTGTIASPIFEPSTVSLDGQVGPTVAPTTTTTQVGPTPTTTQGGQTTTTTAGGGTGDVTLSYSIKEEAPRYTENTLTGSKTYTRGATATLTVKVWAYQDLNTEDMTAIRGFVNLTGATLSGNPSIGEIENHKYPITYTYTVQMNSNVTVTGTIASPIYDPSTVLLDGQSAPSGATTQGGGQTTTTTGGQNPPTPVTGSDSIDLVTLTYNDAACSQYGVSFHSFGSLTTPVVQYVKGTATNDAAFASATTVTATKSSESTREWQNYNASTYEFDYDWAQRATMTTQITTYINKALITGLDFSTTYSYRVGDSATGTWSPIYTFTTRPATVTDFSFIYTADTQPDLGDKKAYNGINKLMNTALSKAPNASFFVSGGDFVYCSDEGQGGISQWRNMINGCNNFNSGNSIFAENPWFVANGNHDNNLVQSYFNNKTTSKDKDYYSYDYGDVHFIVLDSGHSGAIDGTQVTWLENDLKATSKKFKIVFLHWPFYCHEERDIMGSERATVLGLFDTYGVDFVISAHVNADYYTTYPLKNNAVTTKTVSTSGGVEYYTNPGGTIYLQNGASGLSSDYKGVGEYGAIYVGKKDGGKNYTYQEAGLMKDAEKGYEASFMVVKVEGNKLTLNRYYLDKSLNAVLYPRGQVGVIKN